MNPIPLRFSQKSVRTPESPISHFMEVALSNPKLISLAAGFVDTDSLPVEEVKAAIDVVLSHPQQAKLALQYGTTQGHPPLLDWIIQHVSQLDRIPSEKQALSRRNVVLTTGSQQLLYLLSEMLLDTGDIVITESPSYFVYHSVLAGVGVNVLTVPMDDQGMDTSELRRLLERIERAGELHRVKLIYTVDYFQNPTGLTLSAARRQELIEIVHHIAQTLQHRILILEDAAYRELRYEGEELPSLKSLDATGQHVIYAGTFSKPLSPGLKTGYALLPEDLLEPLLRLKGNHDFGSNHFSQHVLTQLVTSGAYSQHVEKLRTIYREKRDILLQSLEEHFGNLSGVSWTQPRGGMFVWMSLPIDMPTSPDSAFLKAALKEGVLYIPGEFGHVSDRGPAPTHEMRLSFGSATLEQIREGIRRLRQAFDSVPCGQRAATSLR